MHWTQANSLQVLVTSSLPVFEMDAGMVQQNCMPVLDEEALFAGIGYTISESIQSVSSACN